MVKRNHSPEYKRIDDVYKFNYTKMKETLIDCRNKLIINKREYWTDNDISMFYAFIMTLYLTGGRISEVLAIRQSDIQLSEDGEWLEILIPTKKLRKDEKGFRVIPIYIKNKDEEYKFAVEPLQRWFDYIGEKSDDDCKLFPISYFQGYEACMKCGFNPHFLRKIFITQKATKYNMSIPVLQKLSGHRSMDNLIPYLAIDTADIKEYFKKGKE